ncbi:MAG TPA: acetamidase/formamidase family protein [Anaerolineae bacterium]|nr:acetamidase/formamidase family protein [Anaerolineae bacterium]
MQLFRRTLIETHCVGEEWPRFCGTVAPGERFAVETVENGPNGPVEVRGIRQGEVVCISVEAIHMVPPFYAPQSGPTFLGCGEPVPLRYEDGWFWWPNHFRLRARPSVGNVAVLPEPDEEIRELCRYQIHGPNPFARNPRGWRRVVRDTRGKHCHQDCAALTAGARIYMRANVDGVGVCVDDVHGYIGQGELGFGAIEVEATVELTVERSDRWAVDWPVIETADAFMAFVSYTSTYVRRPPLKYVDLVKEAYIEVRRLIAARLQIPVEEANTIVATACDIQNCALYGLGENYTPGDRGRDPYDIAIVASLPNSIFADGS